jgi:hypothetical protein
MSPPAGFWVQCVYQFHHAGVHSIIPQIALSVKGKSIAVEILKSGNWQFQNMTYMIHNSGEDCAGRSHHYIPVWNCNAKLPVSVLSISSHSLNYTIPPPHIEACAIVLPEQLCRYVIAQASKCIHDMLHFQWRKLDMKSSAIRFMVGWYSLYDFICLKTYE